MSLEDELRGTLATVAAALDDLNISWAVGGSFASTVYGEPRATNDIDIVACLRHSHESRFLAALGSDFYADSLAMSEAISRRTSFNVIDQRSFLKVDLFVPPPGPLGEGQLQRRRIYSLSDDGPHVFVLGPEDTVLQKLRWFELGGGVSDRQWNDIVAVLRLVRDLEFAYMRRVAEQADLSSSLERALVDAERKE